MTIGDKIADDAYTWLGTPHVNQARVKGIGVDCGMLLIGCAEDVNAVDKGSVKIKPYSNEWHLHHSDEWFLKYVQEYCEEVPAEDMKRGDFLLYQFGRCISHAGIYIGGGRIIHAVINQGVIMSDLNDVMFYDAKGRPRLRKVYRFSREKYLAEVNK